MTAYTEVLKRTGLVLLVVGVVDVAIMIYCIANGVWYYSSFSIFAIIAGVLLLRGSLRAAALVRWFATFTLAALCALFVAWPFLLPVDLALTEFRLNRWSALGAVALAVFGIGLLAWLCVQLGNSSLVAASVAAGRPRRDMRIPAAAGLGLVVLLTVLLSVLLDSEPARKAKALAERQLGPTYRCRVRSLSIHTTQRRRVVHALVTAWNDTEIRNVPVGWEEP